MTKKKPAAVGAKTTLETHRPDGVAHAEPIVHEEAALDPMLPYNLARKEMGVHEIAGPKANEKIVEYFKHTTLKATSDEVPWFSAFMCAMAENAGFKSTRSAAAVSWKDYGKAGDGSVGDIAVFSRVGGHHVAFVNKKFVKGSGVVECLGGNQSDSVKVSNESEAALMCFRRFV